MYEFSVADIDDEISSFEDDDLVTYTYPYDSNGLFLVVHLASTVEREVTIVTPTPRYVEDLIEAYVGDTSLADFEASTQDINVTTEMDGNKVASLSNELLIFHGNEKFPADRDNIDTFRSNMENNSISIWVCDDTIDDYITKVANVSIEFTAEVDQDDSLESITIHKHTRQRSQSHKQLSIEFSPYLTRDTTSTV